MMKLMLVALTCMFVLGCNHSYIIHHPPSGREYHTQGYRYGADGKLAFRSEDGRWVVLDEYEIEYVPEE